jgi:hypothetical protein
MKEQLLELAAQIQEHANQSGDEKLIELANKLSKEVMASTTDSGGSSPSPDKPRDA